MFTGEEKQNFVNLSKFAGERYDLIQGSGGNSSVKSEDGKMLIKASGRLLSDIEENNGYVLVDLKKIMLLLDDSSIIREENKRERESRASILMRESILESYGNNRPSIETFLHGILLHKYILHTHPIAVNMLTCKKGWEEQLKVLFPRALYVKYKTPGIDLALELKHECDKYQMKIGKLPKIIFLQNHGLIISSDDPKEILALNNDIVLTIEKKLGVSLNKYRLTNELTTIMKKAGNNQVISYLSDDYFLRQILNSNRSLLFRPPLYPDTLVFCGYHTIEVADEAEVYKIKEYYDKYHTFPKVVLYKGCLFFISNTLKKAKEIEEVFKSHILTIEQIVGQENPMEMMELMYLNSWEAEEFRQKV